MFIDTHTHLYADAFDADRPALIKKAISAGIKKFFMPNIDLDSIGPMLEVAQAFPENCFPMMGLHPCSVDDNYRAVLDEIKNRVVERKYSAIGEIGIDLYWDKSRQREQAEVFSGQVQLAVDLDLPVVIHTRESFDHVYDCLRGFQKLPRGIFHCFTGTPEQAGKVLSLGGFKLGIGGVLTFKNSGLDKVVASLPMNSLVLETDAPYLAPVPFRGKRNEPAYMLEVARRLAEVKGVTVHEVEEATTTAANEVFGPWN